MALQNIYWGISSLPQPSTIHTHTTTEYRVDINIMMITTIIGMMVFMSIPVWTIDLGFI